MALASSPFDSATQTFLATRPEKRKAGEISLEKGSLDSSEPLGMAGLSFLCLGSSVAVRESQRMVSQTFASP